MFFNSRQFNLFKDVKERTWYRQDRLRTPYRRQWFNVLNNFFKQYANGVKIAYQTASQIMLDQELRKQANLLTNIFKVQYTVIGNIEK